MSRPICITKYILLVMTASYEKTFRASFDRESFIARVRNLVTNKNFSCSRENDVIVILTNPNLFSWGEKIKIQFIENNIVRVKSKCVLKTQIFDWGKNRRNVKMICELA